MKGARLPLVLAAGLLAAIQTAAAQEPGPLYGRPIVSLSFRGDAPVDEDEMARLTELTPGHVLTASGLGASLRNLFATRRFSDLSVQAAPSETGVVVVVVFAAAPRIASLKVVGKDVPARGRLLDAVGLDVNDVWQAESAADVERSVHRILKERGYFEANVVTVVEAGPDETSVDLRVEVTPGPRALTGPAEWNGSVAPLRPAELVKAARLEPGDSFREAKAREDAVRYEALYHKLGRARAEVRYEGERYDGAKRLAFPRYSVFVGPEVVLRVNGAPLSEVKKHPDSPWAKGEPPDEEAARHLADSLKRTYQERGYARAAVDVAIETSPERDVITYNIQRGDRYSIAGVALEGVRSVPLGEVRDAVRTRPRGILEVGRLVERDLAADRDAIVGVYRRHGYPDARVKTSVTDARGPLTLKVTFSVNEGAEVLVAERTVRGARAIPEAEIAKVLKVTPGEPLNASDVDADLAALRALYADRGFVDARVDAVPVFSKPAPGEGEAAGTAKVTYNVFEGEPITFGKTVIRGNRQTRFGIIEREFAHEQGKPFSLSRLIETQQNLSRLGVFQRVEVTNFPTDPEARSRTVLLTVSEGKPWSLLYGVGAEYDEHGDPRFSPRFSLGASYNNLFGRALYVAAEGKYSRREKRLVATARDRSLFDWKVPVTLTVFRTEETRPVDLKRRGTFLEAERRLTKALKTTLRYQYEIVEPDPNVDPKVLSQLERQNQRIAISSVGPGASLDTRDDPIDPHRGLFLAADLKYAFSFLNANARFFKGLGQASLYLPASKSVLAFGVRAGAIESFGTCDTATNPTCPPNLEIPIAERFFAGGRTTHRAFPLDELGIQGETLTRDADGNVVPAGGNALLVGNLEWRLPLYGDLGVSLFLDVGNVWADYRHVHLSELRPGLGFGLHYLTPVGPLRLEYGRKLDRKPGESSGEVSFSIGYPF